MSSSPASSPPPRIGGQAGAIRAPLPLERLVPYLERHVPGFVGRRRHHGQANASSSSSGDHGDVCVDVKQFKFGQSNPTYLLTDAQGQQWVLRRKPSGRLISPTAHKVEREYLVLERIGRYNALLGRVAERAEGEEREAALARQVPVPKVYCLCQDDAIVGAGFYVMEYLKGRIFEDVEMPELESDEERRAW